MATDPIYRPLFSDYASELQPPALRQITARVSAVQGINLGQGTCQVPPPPEVLAAASAAIKEGLNVYTAPRGLLPVRQAIARKLARHNHIMNVDPEKELIVTCGATGALEGICAALLNPGDEVVLFEPYYPYHHKAVQKYGASIRYVPLHYPDWRFDPDDIRRAVTPRTKLVILSTPSNPCGKVFTEAELLLVGRLCKRAGAFLVTDEIYEYMVFDGKKHVSPASISELRPHTLMIGGFSKTFSVTGWRIGFLLAPEALSEKISQVIDLIYVCAPSAFQAGVGRALDELPEAFFGSVTASYQKKRDFFSSALERCGLRANVPEGAYYLLADYSDRFSNLSGMDFVSLMIDRTGVGAVPSQDFVRAHDKERWVRFCVAVSDEVLEKAAKRLQAL